MHSLADGSVETNLNKIRLQHVLETVTSAESICSPSFLVDDFLSGI